MQYVWGKVLIIHYQFTSQLRSMKVIVTTLSVLRFTTTSHPLQYKRKLFYCNENVIIILLPTANEIKGYQNV